MSEQSEQSSIQQATDIKGSSSPDRGSRSRERAEPSEPSPASTMVANLAADICRMGGTGRCTIPPQRFGGPTFEPPELQHKHRQRSQVDPNFTAVIHRLHDALYKWPLFVEGEPGAGKSCAALCVVDWIGGLYITSARLLELHALAARSELRWSTGHARTVHDLWQQWTTANLVVLDELCVRDQHTGFQREVLARALDAREGWPLIVISNKSLNEIAALLDDRCASRLAGGTHVIFRGDRRIERESSVVLCGMLGHE